MLATEGISEITVDLESRRGGDTSGSETKWKVYYRLRSDPNCGVLLRHATQDIPLGQQIALLDAELRNYGILRDSGFDVPKTATSIFTVVDHLAGGAQAAALVVEHVDGVGPYKAFTAARSIGKVIRDRAMGTDATYRDAWQRLATATSRIAPMDMQVLITDDGRIVTIDVEAIGPGRILPPLMI